ncbi:RICIN domain-containing protein [Streptomyces cinnabarinus]|uniref:RICIN domain-containing protein n=1 Tax=Streptomyces cinnabarinus TaxID=67287 RepID=A0ABY7KA28_9ACTN|nr:RICIN domain-containing protein [Streptomyces cinnabarinus]WAZ21374.1 RICIN domain-containing protein [Streptomyces cinnabarinus]
MHVKSLTKISAVAAGALCALAFATPAQAEDDFRPLTNRATGKCLAVPNASTANGTGLIQWGCNGYSEQNWTLTHVAGGNGDRWTIRNQNSLKCIAIPQSSTANGTQAIQWTCDSANTDQVFIKDSWGRLRNVNSDKCLAVPNSSTANGTEIIQWTCSENFNQRWAF